MIFNKNCSTWGVSTKDDAIGLKSMEHIIFHIYNDFINSINNSTGLCTLNSLNYAGEELPSYKHIIVQQLYLLRYAYAYGFEYQQLYKRALELLGAVDYLTVYSIGCGSMIDLWGLQTALKNRTDIGNIHYRGIDAIKWSYMLGDMSKENTSIVFEQIDALEDMNEIPFLNADIVTFPKSISEFSEEKVRLMAKRLAEALVTKERCVVAASIRRTPDAFSEDLNKIFAICSEFTKCGFHSIENLQYYTDNNEAQSLTKFGYEPYPEQIRQNIIRTHQKCKQFQTGECRGGCSAALDRQPIITSSQLCYVVCKFVR